MTPSPIIYLSEDAVSLPVKAAQEVQNIARMLRQSGEWDEVVAGLDSVTIYFDPLQHSMQHAEAALLAAVHARGTDALYSGAMLEIPVKYGGDDGPDLEKVCSALNISQSDFIQSHTSIAHRIEMIGFTPGFAYVSGLPASYSVPRLTSPRPRVPSGSVGVSAGYTGLYGLAGPGGWPLIGRTEMSLFDPSKSSPFILQAGQTLRFVSA